MRVYDETAAGTEVAIHLDTRYEPDLGPRARIEIDPDPDQGGGGEAGHDYRLALGADLTDLAGNPLAGPRDWHFTAAPGYPLLLDGHCRRCARVRVRSRLE